MSKTHTDLCRLSGKRKFFVEVGVSVGPFKSNGYFRRKCSVRHGDCGRHNHSLSGSKSGSRSGSRKSDLSGSGMGGGREEGNGGGDGKGLHFENPGWSDKVG